MKRNTTRRRGFLAFVTLIGMLLMSSGFAIMATAGGASAAEGDEPCVPSDGTSASYTEWVDQGSPVLTHANAAPAADTETERYRPVGEPSKHVTQEYIAPTPGTEGHWENLRWFVWTGGPRDNAPGLNEGGWNGVPALPNGLPHEPVPGNVYNVSHGESGLGSWFKYDGDWIEGTPGDPGQEEESHLDYLWQKQVRELVPGTDPVVCEVVEPPTETCPDGSPIVEGEPCDEEVAGPPPGEEPPVAAPPVNNPSGQSAPTAGSVAAGTPAAGTPSSAVGGGTTIPSTVSAGLGSDVAQLASARTAQGTALVGVGALVMLAGGLGMVRRRGVLARI